MSYHLNRVVALFYLSPGTGSFIPGLVVSHPWARSSCPLGWHPLISGLKHPQIIL